MSFFENSTYRAFAREKLTVSNSVKQLTASVFDPAPESAQRVKGAKIVVEAQSLRYTEDGTDPVATTTGVLAAAGTVIALKGLGAIRRFKAIREGGSDSTIEVVYYR